VFIAGAPRTGTTVLHALLALDPDARVPEGWELLRPVPPPDPAAYPDEARVVLADQELRRPALVVEGLDAIHLYGGRMHKECVSSMSFQFRSEEFTARYRVPSYARWLAQCDMRPAYEWHRLVLQILQRRFDGRRWTLKSPVHMHSLPTLLAVYPDARIVFTHRDPLAVLASVTSLIATMRYAHSDAFDFADIGDYHVELYGRSLERLVDLTESGALAPARVHHAHYAEFIDDPLDMMSTVSEWLGRPMTPALVESMRRHLAANPQGAHGAHQYSFDDLARDRETTRKRFARYQAAFAVAEEEVQ
jgi:Sulfotransferase family